jgi:hypothetical protein
VKIVLGATTLADITATPRSFATFAAMGLEGDIQEEKLYEAAAEWIKPRGNVNGLVTFSVACSYATVDAAIDALKAHLALVNTQASLVITPRPGGHSLTFAGAIVKSVEREEWGGVRIKVRFNVRVTTLA